MDLKALFPKVFALFGRFSHQGSPVRGIEAQSPISAGTMTDQGTIEFLGYVVLTYQFTQEDDYCIGECMELGTVEQAKSLGKAAERLERAVCLHLTALTEVGEINRVFKEKGIRFWRQEPQDQESEVTAPLGAYVRRVVERIPAIAAP